MRVVLYMRVSTEEQVKEGNSLPNQKRKLLAYCEAHDWSVVGIYCDEGISGSSIEKREMIDTLFKKIYVNQDGIHKIELW